MTVYIQVLNGVTHHFPARRSEWALSAMMFLTGLLLLHPDVMFDERVTLFRTLAAIASEVVWGWLCLGFGAARLAALLVNGTFGGAAYSRWSPHVRGGFAFMSCFYWATITIGLLASMRPLFALGCYPMLLLLDISNVHQAFLDAGEADRGAEADAI